MDRQTLLQAEPKNREKKITSVSVIIVNYNSGTLLTEAVAPFSGSRTSKATVLVCFVETCSGLPNGEACVP